MEGFNNFNVNDEFFVIDSLNIASVHSKLYGYFFTERGVFEQNNYDHKEFKKNNEGRGCYVNVIVNENEIEIFQDFVGSYGIYLYQEDNYFALSNSFLRLAEHLNSKLNIDLDFAYHYLPLVLETKTFDETPIKEIKLIDRSSYIIIDKKSNKLNIYNNKYREGEYNLDSQEGIESLDKWFDFWTCFIKNLYSKTKSITIDLSGGYDSRLTFLLALCSGINLSNIRVFSSNDKLHTHSEDYEIASKIASYYNFQLNKALPNSKYINNSLEDIINIEFYTKMGFHKEIYPQTRKYINKVFNITGAAGEAIRSIRWDKEFDEFVDTLSSDRNTYSYYISQKIYNSNKRIYRNGFNKVKNKYNLKENSKQCGHNLLWDTQCRNHCGKNSVLNYLSNRITLNPLMDSSLLKINLNTYDCKDNNLIMLMIYIRYCPKLLDFPFEGKRYSLDAKTKEYAINLNSKFPLSKTSIDNIKHSVSFAINNKSEENSLGNNNEISSRDVECFIKNVFYTPEIRSLFTSVFEDEFYYKADKYLKNSRFFPLRHAYSIISIAKIISITRTNNKNREFLSLYSQLSNYIALANYKVECPILFEEKFKDYITARIDIKLICNSPSMANDDSFYIDYVSDIKCNIQKPNWFQNNGIGYILTSNVGDIEIHCKSVCHGQLCIYLRSIDVRDKYDSNVKIPYWINYQKFTVNNALIFDRDENLIWHDKPYIYKIDAKENSEFKIKLSWLPTFNRI